MRCALFLLPFALMASYAYSQEANNPFEFQVEVAPEQPLAVAPVSTQQFQTQSEELSRIQREEVLLLLAEALEKASVSGGQGIYQIDGFRKYFVIEDDDEFVGMLNGSYIIKDSSRDKLEFIPSKGFMGVVTKTEWAANIQTIITDLTDIERSTIGVEAFVSDAGRVRDNAVSGSVTNNSKLQLGDEQKLD